MLSIKTFPDDLHREARSAAALADEPLQELVIRAVRAEVKRMGLERGGVREEQ